MKLSIIVPVYNVEPYLIACLDSLVKQSVDDYEVILVDDGSTDRSGVICDEYAASYPALVRTIHIENGGQGRARNFGIDIAKGTYLGFVDSDDWVDMSMYEKLLNRAEVSNADIVVCDFLGKYQDGREEYLPAGRQENRFFFAGSSCNKIFRKSLVAELRFPAGLWYEDFFFSAVLLSRSGKTEYIRESLYIYRLGQASTMHNDNARKNLDIIKIMDMLENASLPRDAFEFFVINHVLLDGINRLSSQESPDKQAIISELRNYVHYKIPRLSACAAFKAETRNRRIIMRLNYLGMERLSRRILRIKSGK